VGRLAKHAPEPVEPGHPRPTTNRRTVLDISLFTAIFLLFFVVVVLIAVWNHDGVGEALGVLFVMVILYGLGYGAGYNRGLELGRQALEAYILSLE